MCRHKEPCHSSQSMMQKAKDGLGNQTQIEKGISAEVGEKARDARMFFLIFGLMSYHW